MAWRIEFSKQAEKQLDELDATARRRILRFLVERVAILDDPHTIGSSLTGSEYQGVWRYRVGDYRILARIENESVRVLVVRVGHRGEIYR